MATATTEKVHKASTHWGAHVDEIATAIAHEVANGGKVELRSLFDIASHDVEIDDLIGAGGSSLDEHINGGVGRKKSSAFDIAIEQLGLTENYHAKKLAEFVNRTDSGGGTEPFEMSSILQDIHRSHPGSSENGINWTTTILRCYWKDTEYFKRPALECGKIFESIGVAWLLCKFGKKKKSGVYELISSHSTASFAKTIEDLGEKNEVLAYLAKFFEDGCQRMLQPFALPRSISSVYYKKGVVTAVKLAFEALDAKFDAQEKFISAQNDLAGADEFRAGRFNAIMVTTNNREMKNWILHSRKDVAIIAIKNPWTNQVQIFSNAMTGVRFEGLAAAIRIEEKTLAGEPIDELFDKELEAAGNSCGVGNWYFIVRRNEDGVTKGSYMLLNGSDSYPNMAPTKISWERLKEIIISVF